MKLKNAGKSGSLKSAKLCDQKTTAPRLTSRPGPPGRALTLIQRVLCPRRPWWRRSVLGGCPRLSSAHSIAPFLDWKAEQIPLLKLQAKFVHSIFSICKLKVKFHFSIFTEKSKIHVDREMLHEWWIIWIVHWRTMVILIFNKIISLA